MPNNTRPDELMHYGVLGMKWGVRRYQNKVVNKAKKKVKAIDKDIKRLNSTKKGRKTLTEQDVKNKVKALNELKLNTITKTDVYKKGLEESKKK